MWRYIVAHWQGHLSLWRSVLVNWLLVYVLLTFLAGLMGALSSKLPALDALPIVFTFLGAMLVWLVWAVVGAARCGIKLLRDPQSSGWCRAWALVAILILTAFTIGVSSDLFHIGSTFAEGRIFGISQ